MIRRHGNGRTIGYKERKKLESLGPRMYCEQLLAQKEVYGEISPEDKKQLKSITARLSGTETTLSGLEKGTKTYKRLEDEYDVMKSHLYIVGTKYRINNFVQNC